MKVSYLAGMDVSASGLAAQRAVMNATAENLANSQTTRTETGDPYRRKTVPITSQVLSFSAQMRAEVPNSAIELLRTDPAHLEPQDPPTVEKVRGVSGVKTSVEEDMSDFPQVYDPGHPDADANGMVRMPNVDMAREMVTLMAASRAYEANLAALSASRRLAEASLNLAR